MKRTKKTKKKVVLGFKGPRKAPVAAPSTFPKTRVNPYYMQNNKKMYG